MAKCIDWSGLSILPLVLISTASFADCRWEFKDNQEYLFKFKSVQEFKCHCRQGIFPTSAKLEGCLVEVEIVDKSIYGWTVTLKAISKRADICSATTGSTVKAKPKLLFCNDVGMRFYPLLKKCDSDEWKSQCLYSKASESLE